jgi:hypothetical protein
MFRRSSTLDSVPNFGSIWSSYIRYLKAARKSASNVRQETPPVSVWHELYVHLQQMSHFYFGYRPVWLLAPQQTPVDRSSRRRAPINWCTNVCANNKFSCRRPLSRTQPYEVLYIHISTLLTTEYHVHTHVYIGRSGCFGYRVGERGLPTC